MTDGNSNSQPGKAGLFARLRQGLARSAGALSTSLSGLMGGQKLDEATLETLEETLIRADMGAATAARLTSDLAKARFGKEASDTQWRTTLAEGIAAILTPVAQPFAIDRAKKPFVVLVAGVNGAGKTTTIGKLAAHLASQGYKVVLAAGDTFRAAAIEQLVVWGKRAKADVVAGKQGADAAGLAFEALEHAQASGADVLLIDTAGRLQNKVGLMAELEKIVRVLKKRMPDAPHASLLVLDATTGQNALAQVEAFQTAIPLTGLIMTKLDGTAKGGILVALAERFGLPVHFIGVGESIEDFQVFQAENFAKALTGAGELSS
jgi:fused signal recognition particle receptor